MKEVLMGVLEQLKKDFPNSPDCVHLKAALLFYGVQFDRLLAEAGKWAFPNFMPYHLPPGEAPFEGQRRIAIPYLFRMEDDTQVRIRIKDESPFPWNVVPTSGGFILWQMGSGSRERPLNQDLAGLTKSPAMGPQCVRPVFLSTEKCWC